MAGSTLFITEYSDLGWVGVNSNQLIHAPSAQTLLAEQALMISASNAVSVAFNAKTKFIEIVGDVDVAISFGTTNAVTADATKHYIPAKSTRYYGVQPLTFIAGIASS